MTPRTSDDTSFGNVYPWVYIKAGRRERERAPDAKPKTHVQRVVAIACSARGRRGVMRFPPLRRPTRKRLCLCGTLGDGRCRGPLRTGTTKEANMPPTNHGRASGCQSVPANLFRSKLHSCGQVTGSLAPQQTLPHPPPPPPPTCLARRPWLWLPQWQRLRHDVLRPGRCAAHPSWRRPTAHRASQTQQQQQQLMRVTPLPPASRRRGAVGRRVAGGGVVAAATR